MDDDAPARVRQLLRQQAAIAGFGSFALRQTDLSKVLTEAARACAGGLGVPFSKVCRYRAAENDLVIEAGHGWNKGVVGFVYRADDTSPQGRAFITGNPTICKDLRKDNEYELPDFYAEHGIVSTIDVVIKGGIKPFGVLEIDNNQQHDYDQHDIDFVMSFANVLSEAVATSGRTTLLQTTIKQMQALVEDKDRLLDQKLVLAEELQHRVRNNLHLVYGMLTRQMVDTTEGAGLRGLRSIARRVFTLAQVYDHLLGTEISRTTDFGAYLKSLCLGLAELQADGSGVTLTCDSDSLLLDLDTVTALGLVVAELVANSFDHAFKDGKGLIGIVVRRPARDNGMAILTINDNGKGFVASAESKRHGLGLVRRLVQQIRGTIAVDSKNGTAWTVKFPVAFAIVAPPAALSA